jgi:hypothetical protein
LVKQVVTEFIDKEALERRDPVAFASITDPTGAYLETEWHQSAVVEDWPVTAQIKLIFTLRPDGVLLRVSDGAVLGGDEKGQQKDVVKNEVVSLIRFNASEEELKTRLDGLKMDLKVGYMRSKMAASYAPAIERLKVRKQNWI